MCEARLAERSAEQNHEKHGRAYGRMYIAQGTGTGTREKPRKQLSAKSGQKHHWKERLERKREHPAIREQRRLIIC
jgi:hypothetical protein